MENRLRGILRQLEEIREYLDDYSQELEREDESIGYTTPESVASAELTLAWLSLGEALPMLEGAVSLLAGEADFRTEYKRMEKRLYGEGPYAVTPLLTPEQVTLPVRRLINELAKAEQEELGILRRAGARKDYPSEDEFRRDMLITKKSIHLREELLDREEMRPYTWRKHPAEQRKAVAALLFFLYAQDRIRKVLTGEKPYEPLYYAAENLYRYAVAMQQLDEELEEEEED